MIPDLPQKVPLFNSPQSNQEKPAHPHTFSPAQIVVTKRREMLPCFVSIFQYQLLFSIFQLHLNSRGYWDCDLLIRHYFHFPPCSPQFSLPLSLNAQYLITPHTKHKKVAGNFCIFFIFSGKILANKKEPKKNENSNLLPSIFMYFKLFFFLLEENFFFCSLAFHALISQSKEKLQGVLWKILEKHCRQRTLTFIHFHNPNFHH